MLSSLKKSISRIRAPVASNYSKIRTKMLASLERGADLHLGKTHPS